MKDLLISIVVFILVLFTSVFVLNALGASDSTVGGIAFFMFVTYFFLFLGHVREIIKEMNLLYVLSRGSKPGSLIRKIKGLTKRKKQYKKVSSKYESKVSDLFDSTAKVLISNQDTKQNNLKEEINKNKQLIEQYEKDYETKKKDKHNKISALMSQKMELIRKIEVSENSKRKKIDALKKDISDERSIYKDLKSRHKLIAKWVKNR